jgi:LPXTG-motif cell wall-anchored protein
VLSTSDESANIEQMKNAEIGHIDEQGRMRGDDFPAATTASTTTSSSRDAQLKNSAGNAPAATAGTAGRADTAAPRAATAPRRLPRTGSNLSLLGLISALSLAAGLGLRRSRNADAV